eukprot:11131695-Ditylum_brightwellii.AAC.1
MTHWILNQATCYIWTSPSLTSHHAEAPTIHSTSLMTNPENYGASYLVQRGHHSEPSDTFSIHFRQKEKLLLRSGYMRRAPSPEVQNLQS